MTGRYDYGSRSEWCDVKRTQSTIAGFKYRERGSWAKKYGYPLKDENGKEMYALLETPEGNTALVIAQFSLRSYIGHLTYKTIG